MNTTIKVTLEYLKSLTSPAHEYKIARIAGSPNVQVMKLNSKERAYETVRVGDIITEQQAEELSTRVDVNTGPRTDR